MSEAELKNVTLVTDGACIGNPGPGGWAAILQYWVHEKTFVGAEGYTTNKKMEITAAIRGGQAIRHRVRLTIVTNSQYLISAFYVSGGGRGYHYGGTTGATPLALDGDGWTPTEMTHRGSQLATKRNNHRLRAFCRSRLTGGREKNEDFP